MEFHIGDRVAVSQEARVDRGASFIITEFKQFNDELCATGEGHAWWPVKMLDYDLTDEQKALAEKYERLLHAYREAEKEIEALNLDIILKLPEWWHERMSRIE